MLNLYTVDLFFSTYNRDTKEQGTRVIRSAIKSTPELLQHRVEKHAENLDASSVPHWVYYSLENYSVLDIQYNAPLWDHIREGDLIQVWCEERPRYGSPYYDNARVKEVDRDKSIIRVRLFDSNQPFCMRTGYRLDDGYFRITGITTLREDDDYWNSMNTP